MIEAGIISDDERFDLVDGEIALMASKRIACEWIKSAITTAVARPCRTI